MATPKATHANFQAPGWNTVVVADKSRVGKKKKEKKKKVGGKNQRNQYKISMLQTSLQVN